MEKEIVRAVERVRTVAVVEVANNVAVVVFVGKSQICPSSGIILRLMLR